MLMLHNARCGCVKARTAKANDIRGELAEFGVVLPKGAEQAEGNCPMSSRMRATELSTPVRQLLLRLYEQLRQLDAQVEEFDVQIGQASRNNAACRRLQEVPGIGRLTASAFVAKIGDARTFANGRQVSSWLGMVPTALQRRQTGAAWHHKAW